MTDRPMKRAADSRLAFAEIVGEESLQGQRMQAGAILDLIDVLAGRIAARHAGGAVVTLCFDRVDLVYPILHQDLVRMEGRLVAVGNSSLTVFIQGYRRDLLSREFVPIQHCFVTMVAVDKTLRPNADIPGLLLESAEEKRLNADARDHKERSTEWEGRLESSGHGGPLEVAEVEDSFAREKKEWLAPGETEIALRRIFLPRHNNILGTIFGGDILLWMDRVATYTARHFTRNPHMVTIAMNRIFFRQPIFNTDVVELTARVVHVRNYTLEVEIDVRAQRFSGEEVQSHCGYFTVLNYDEAGFKRPIVTGLKLSGDDQPGLRRYLQSRKRFDYWKGGDSAKSRRPGR
ncbi:MAG: hotdog domain-containing protein [bacterium]